MLLVTGATGFIGSNLVKYLIERGYEVRVFVRNFQKAKNIFGDRVEIVKGVFQNKEDVQKAVKDVDIVIHLAGVVKLKPKEEVWESNFLTTKYLLEECKRVEKFIFSSTIDVYGPLKVFATEEHPLNPIDVYARSKVEAEKVVVQSGIDYSILRIGIVYGVGARWWEYAFKFLKFGFIPKTNNVTHLIHVSDLVKAIEKVVNKGKKNSVYNVANERPTKIKSVFSYIVKLFGKKPREIPMFLVKTVGTLLGMKDVIEIALMNRKVDVSRAKKELGFRTKANMKEILREMVEYYKKVQA